MPPRASSRPDLGLTHVALQVTDVDSSIDFYQRYAQMRVVHRRVSEGGHAVAWLSDCRRSFAIVLVERDSRVEGRLEGVAHLGIACSSCSEVDALCALAQSEGHLHLAPENAGPPVGYRAMLRDPDGHNLELSHGQRVELAVEQEPSGTGRESARSPSPAGVSTGSTLPKPI